MNIRGALLLGLLPALFMALVSCQQGAQSETPGMVQSLPTPSAESMPAPPTAEPAEETADMRQELPARSLIISNGTVIDGTGADPVADGLVAIEGNRITAVGPAAGFKIPDDAVVIDAGGGTILPGIINAHVHNGNGVGTRRTLFLLNGVTSVCDLGIPLFMMKGFEEEGFKAGPAARGFKAGPFITVPGGYPGAAMERSMNYEIQGAVEAEAAVRDLHARGVDYIKVALEPGYDGENWPMLNVKELRAVVATAHANDRLVRAHVTKSDLLEIALEAGVDAIEHVPMPSEAPEDLAPMFDEAGVFHLPAEVQAVLLRMIDQNVVLVPTLEVYLADPKLLDTLEPGTDVFNHPVFQAVLAVVRFFHDSGGIIALGNDYGARGAQSGMPLHEMELLQAAGLSPHEVLEAATRHAAAVCGHRDELGTLEKGKLADLIVVDGDPLDDLAVMDKLLVIVKDGEIALTPDQESK